MVQKVGHDQFLPQPLSFALHSLHFRFCAQNSIFIPRRPTACYMFSSGCPPRIRYAALVAVLRASSPLFICVFTRRCPFLFPDTDNQRVIIHVKDVNDEPPYFINRPLPMQAVVQLNAPPNTPVFTLQARDPDTDHNIHYFIVRDRSEYSV